MKANGDIFKLPERRAHMWYTRLPLALSRNVSFGQNRSRYNQPQITKQQKNLWIRKDLLDTEVDNQLLDFTESSK